MTIEYLDYRHDILKTNADALVIPVNCVGIMGAGLALQYRKAYPEQFKRYAAVCKQGNLHPGGIAILSPTGDVERFDVMFATKNHWNQSSELGWIISGMARLTRYMNENDVNSVAIPAIGVGLGNLRWTDVREFIEASHKQIELSRPFVKFEVYLPR